MLQEKVFPHLDHNEIEYNPPQLFDLIHRLQYRFEMEESEKYEIISEAARLVRNYEKEGRRILISNENLSQLCFFQNYEESANLINKIFPNAQILLFLRYQPSWLLSCYKQSMKMGDWQSIDSFLNFDGISFNTTNTEYNDRGLLHMDIHKTDYVKLISIYKRLGYEVHTFFYEKFLQNPALQVNNMMDLIGHNHLNNVNYYNRVNKGMGHYKIRALITLSKLAYALPFEYLIKYREARTRHYDIYYNPRLKTDVKCGKIKSKKRKDSFYYHLYRFLDLLPTPKIDLLEQKKMKGLLDKIFHEKNKQLTLHLDIEEIPKKYIQSSHKKSIKFKP